MTTPDLLLYLDTAEVYRAGYPMYFGITLENALPKRTYFSLPEIDPFTVPPPVQLVVTAPGEEQGQVLPAHAMGVGEDDPEGMRLGPGEMRRMAFDLSELHPRLVAGRHRLDATYLARPLRAMAEPVDLEIELPPRAEADAVARLRASNRAGVPSWNAFLLDNFREIEPEELRDIPEHGRARLGFTLALHRAIHGPLGPDRLAPDTFDGLGTGPLTGEIRVLVHEMLAARGDAAATALAHTIVGTWPGLSWRVAENTAKAGMLTRLRRIAGADRGQPPPPSPLPYTSAQP